MTVSNSTFTGNSVRGNGGGIYNDMDVTITMIDSVFANNSAGIGGGIDNGGGILMVSDSTFASNSAALGGGLLNVLGGLDNEVDGTLTVTNCTISGNTSQDAGGGIFNEAGSANPKLNNTIVAGNTSADRQ